MGLRGEHDGTAPGPDGSALDKAAFVPELFDRIAPHYDLMNVVMTAGAWWLWKRAFARIAAIPRGAQVLDVGCGTAELSLLLARTVGPGGAVVGVDLAPRMLEVGRRKVTASPHASRVSLERGDATDLPFADGAFDAAASAFVMRNVADLDRALREMARVVRADGRIAIMELSPPPPSPLRGPFLFYFRRVLPLLGMWAERAGLPVAPYAWLPRSLESFPDADALVRRMQDAGMDEVRYARMTAGVVCVHTARVARRAA